MQGEESVVSNVADALAGTSATNATGKREKIKVRARALRLPLPALNNSDLPKLKINSLLNHWLGSS